MRKTLALFLCIIMLLALVACGSSGENTDLEDQKNPTQSKDDAKDEQTDVDLPNTDNNDTDIKEPDNNDTANDKQDEQPQPEGPGEENPFEEITVVDNDECTIRLTALDPDNFWGYTVKAYLENKSSEKTYVFSLNNAFINGVECVSMFAADVAPEKKSNEEVTIMTDSLDEAGITEFTDIQLSFRVYDSNDWTADEVAEETVHIYPYGEENAVNYVREVKPEDNVILDDDYVTVIVTGYEIDEIWGYTANLFLYNKSDKEVMISVDNVSVNGFMADPFWAHSVMPGKCAFSSMSWSDSIFEENAIEEVSEIEFTLRVSDANDWTADNYAEESVVLNP